MSRYNMMNEWGMSSMQFFGPVMMIGFLIALIAVIVLVFRLFSNNHSSSTRASAIELLHERFARGEIDEAEYRRISKIIGV